MVLLLGFLCGSDGKESACKVGDLGSIPGLLLDSRLYMASMYTFSLQTVLPRKAIGKQRRGSSELIVCTKLSQMKIIFLLALIIFHLRQCRTEKVR